jgi:hypothetical protein
MKHHSTTILVAVIVAVLTFIATNALLPREAAAPGNESAQAPIGSVIIPMNIVSIEEHASTSPTIAAEYPQFPSLPADFNADIGSSTNTRLTQFRQDISDNQTARNATSANPPGQPGAAIPPSAYSFLASWEPAQVNSRYVSFVERHDSYSGGTNENQDLVTFNYDMTANKPVTLNDLFGTHPNYLNTISVLARAQLSESLTAASNGNVSTEMLDAGTEPVADNFQNFTFTDYSVTFYFPKYAVAPGSFGEQKVTIPRSAVK